MCRKLTRRKREGVTAVEFALVAPVFILMMFACFEFMRFNMINNLVQDAAYFAARNCMVPGATADEAEEAANRILGFMNTQGAEVIINNGAGLSESSSSVSVTINVPVNDNALFLPTFSEDMVLSSTAEMQTERYSGYYED